MEASAPPMSNQFDQSQFAVQMPPMSNMPTNQWGTNLNQGTMMDFTTGNLAQIPNSSGNETTTPLTSRFNLSRMMIKMTLSQTAWQLMVMCPLCIWWWRGAREKRDKALRALDIGDLDAFKRNSKELAQSASKAYKFGFWAGVVFIVLYILMLLILAGLGRSVSFSLGLF